LSDLALVTALDTSLVRFPSYLFLVACVQQNLLILLGNSS